MKHFLFVCTGNTCRSPMAESLFRRLAEESGLDVEVRSAGVSALNGQSMAQHSAAVLQGRGIDAGAFASREVTASLIEWADLILTMTAHHKRHLLEMYPQAVDRAYTLKEYALLEDPSVLEAHRRREALLAEMQIKLATNQPITEEERERYLHLESELPNVDIGDPIGGPLTLYERTANEIEDAIRLIIRSLKRQ